MMITDIRYKLHQFIDIIEDAKLEAMYILFKEDIERDELDYSKDLEMEVNRRYTEIESGQTKGSAWEEVKHKARHSNEDK